MNDLTLTWAACLPGNDMGTCRVCGTESVSQGTRYVDGHVDLFCNVCGQNYVTRKESHPGDVEKLQVEERALTARTNELMRKDLGDYMSPNCPVYNGKCRYYLAEGTRICDLREKIDEYYGTTEEKTRCAYNI